MSSSGKADSAEVIARIEGALDVVEHSARQFRRQIGHRIDLDDLRSAGREGLLQAARQFDAALGVPFRRWANLRVRGAMIDYARSQTGLPRRVYQTLKALQAARDVSAAHADEPQSPSAEQADEALDARLAQSATAMAIGFLSMQSADVVPVADEQENAEEQLGRHQQLQLVRRAIEQQPEAERTLLLRHYFDGLTLEQAGRELGLSKSWASRLHARALASLTSSLRDSA